MANELTKADPLRFPKNAAVLAPVIPVLFMVSGTVNSVGPATTMKFTKRKAFRTWYDKAIEGAPERAGEP